MTTSSAGRTTSRADRQVAEQLIAAFPETPLIAQQNRAFLRRTVEFLVDAGILARLTGRLTPGSYLAVSHFTDDARGDATEGMEIYRRGGIEVTSRTRTQVEALFDGYDLLEPGLVWVPQWRPESPEDVGDQPEASGVYAGVGRKP